MQSTEFADTQALIVTRQADRFQQWIEEIQNGKDSPKVGTRDYLEKFYHLSNSEIIDDVAEKALNLRAIYLDAQEFNPGISGLPQILSFLNEGFKKRISLPTEWPVIFLVRPFEEGWRRQAMSFFEDYDGDIVFIPEARLSWAFPEYCSDQILKVWAAIEH